MNNTVKAEVSARIERIKNSGDFFRYSPRYRNEDPYEFTSIWCGDLEHIKPGGVIQALEYGDYVFFAPSYCSGSDYSGDTVTKANFKVLIDKFEKNRCVFEMSGDYAYGILIDILAPLPEFYAIIEGLDSYPLIDENELCQVESDAEQEAWEGWLESDLKSEICKTFDLDYDEVDSDSLREWLYEAMNETNEYFIFETGGGAFLRIEELLKKTSEETDSKLLKIGFYADDPESVETV